LASGVSISPRSAVIVTYALLGFANFSSIAIQIGGIGGLAPERRGEIARFGLRAMIAGNLAAFTSASIAGMLA
ncbi:MAG TPA: nucleoside transporter C-terminal domain-containing protein, partial [Gemmatimonadales bacterium]|nr:nucleoside transporter C-terminal domain-containing protein [Gemmatimonadales bacterium]